MCDTNCCYSLSSPQTQPPPSLACTVEQAECVNKFVCDMRPNICPAGYLPPTATFNWINNEYCFSFTYSAFYKIFTMMGPISNCSRHPQYECLVNPSSAIQSATPSLIITATSKHNNSKAIQIGVGVGVGVGGFLLIVALIVLLICCIRKRKRQRESMKSVTVNNDYTTVQIPNATADSAPIYTPPALSNLSDDTSNNIITPRSPQPSNDNNDYEDALAVDTNKAQNLTKGKFGKTTTTYPSAPSSEFTITENDMYQATTGENVAPEVNSSYSLEKFSENGVLSKKTTDIGYEGFTIVENDMYH